MGQKVDPLSGELFVSTAYKPLPTDGAGEEKGEEGQEDEEQEKEEEDTENHKKVRDEFEEDLVSHIYMYTAYTCSCSGPALYTCTCYNVQWLTLNCIYMYNKLRICTCTYLSPAAQT